MASAFPKMMIQEQESTPFRTPMQSSPPPKSKSGSHSSPPKKKKNRVDGSELRSPLKRVLARKHFRFMDLRKIQMMRKRKKIRVRHPPTPIIEELETAVPVPASTSTTTSTIKAGTAKFSDSTVGELTFYFAQHNHREWGEYLFQLHKELDWGVKKRFWIEWGKNYSMVDLAITFREGF